MSEETMPPETTELEAVEVIDPYGGLEYNVVQARSINGLVDAVRDAMSRGGFPLGGPGKAFGSSGSIFFQGVMVPDDPAEEYETDGLVTETQATHRADTTPRAMGQGNIPVSP